MTANRRHRGSGVRRGAIGAIALLLVGIAIPPSVADDLDDLQDEQQQIQDDQEAVAAALEGTNDELAAAYLALDDVNRRLPIAEDELVTANAELAAAERHLSSVQDRLAVAQQQQTDLQAEIDAGETEMATTEDAMGEVARTAYRGGESLGTLSLVFGAASAEEFAQDYSAMSSALRTQDQALTDLENLQAVNRNRQARLDAVEERIAELEAEAEAAVAAADAARQAAEDLVAEIKQLKSEQEAKAADLEALKGQYQDQQAALQAENDRVEQEIADEIAAIAAREAAERERQQQAAAAAAAAGNSGGGGGGGGGSAAAPTGATFIRPIARALYVTSPYGMRWYPITGGYFFHSGVDLRSSCGEAQFAAAAGTVIGVRPAAGNGTHGNQVLINHGVIGGNSWVSVYNHMSRFAVSTGQTVSQGQVIGYTGATGNVTGCHVHFELWKNGGSVNPMGYIS